jgi:arylsulfatase A-like enzyme
MPIYSLLESYGHLNDTVVIITADHGEEFSEHGGLSHDGKMCAELIDVPLLIYNPSLAQGLVCDSVVSTVDVSPTILHSFGLDPVPAFQGHSLLPFEEYPKNEAFGEAIDKHGPTERGASHGVFFYREGDLKVIYREKDDSWELYDLKKDPKELNNAVNESPQFEAMKAKLMPRIGKWRKSAI